MQVGSYSSQAASAGAALDVLIVRHADGTLRSTDWHVVFEPLRKASKVTLSVNGQAVPNVFMTVVGELTPAYFAREAAGDDAPTAAQPPSSMLNELVASGALGEGRNELLYTLEDGRAVQAWLYLWHAHSRCIIFDVDGTITLNDAVGHVGCVGTPPPPPHLACCCVTCHRPPWSPGRNVFDQSFIHPGVCEFLCQLHSRGYQLFFLTARGLVGPAGIERTRRYLFEIAIDRESGFRLPQSPLFTTRHTSTMSALKEELGLGSGGGSKAFKLAQLARL